MQYIKLKDSDFIFCLHAVKNIKSFDQGISPDVMVNGKLKAWDFYLELPKQPLSLTPVHKKETTYVGVINKFKVELVPDDFLAIKWETEDQVTGFYLSKKQVKAFRSLFKSLGFKEVVYMGNSLQIGDPYD